MGFDRPRKRRGSQLKPDPLDGVVKATMEHSDVFLTLAEVSVAFAGFSGIVAVFGRRDPGTWSLGDRYRFFSLVETSLVSAFLSLIPFGCTAMGLSPRTLWALSSILFVAYMVTSYLVHTLQYRSLPTDARAGAAWADVYATAIVDVVIVGLCVYNLMILREAGPFLLALLLLVGQSGFFFSRLLFQALGRPAV